MGEMGRKPQGDRVVATGREIRPLAFVVCARAEFVPASSGFGSKPSKNALLGLKMNVKLTMTTAHGPQGDPRGCQRGSLVRGFVLFGPSFSWGLLRVSSTPFYRSFIALRRSNPLGSPFVFRMVLVCETNREQPTNFDVFGLGFLSPKGW